MGWHEYVPFAAMVTHKMQSDERRVARPLVTRIFELFIVGAVSTVVGIYANDIRLTDRMDAMSDKLAEVSMKIDKMQNDLYVPIAGGAVSDNARLKHKKPGE